MPCRPSGLDTPAAALWPLLGIRSTHACSLSSRVWPLQLLVQTRLPRQTPLFSLSPQTKFTPVDLQALLKPTTAPAAAPDPADEPRKMPSASASTNGQRASQPPHAWATPSTAGGLPARAVESGKPMSFADVVGSSPPPPPSATSASKLKLGAPGGAMRRSVIDGGSSSSHRSNSNSNTTRHGVVGVGGTGGGRGEWVSTGDAVREQYEQARKEAGELAR